MGKFVKVAKIDDIPSGEALQVDVAGHPCALVRVDGDVYCVDDICTHEHAHLSEGFVEGHEIECPLHGSIFDVRTGEVKSLPATEDLRTYPVKIEDGDVLVEAEDGE
ncbi:MAG: bifunctional 3-phenylpropionate/cinnamic acid dioxygenase ferredoxin subunit [Actinomycetota bacterium]